MMIGTGEILCLSIVAALVITLITLVISAIKDDEI